MKPRIELINRTFLLTKPKNQQLGKNSIGIKLIFFLKLHPFCTAKDDRFLRRCYNNNNNKWRKIFFLFLVSHNELRTMTVGSAMCVWWHHELNKNKTNKKEIILENLTAREFISELNFIFYFPCVYKTLKFNLVWFKNEMREREWICCIFK